jgi:signal transduction histidine kinase
MSYLLHPPQLDEAGLVPAVQAYVKGFSQRSGIHVDLVVPKELGRLPKEVETALFRVIQECLTDIRRHSSNSTARIVLKRTEGAVRLLVADAGGGQGDVMPHDTEELFSDVQEVGIGIPGVRYRLHHLGGRLGTRTTQQGTTVMATVPIQGETLRDVRTAVRQLSNRQR